MAAQGNTVLATGGSSGIGDAIAAKLRRLDAYWLSYAIFGLLLGSGPRAAPTGRQHSREELSDAEAHVLRYLPTHLTAGEIAAELYVSVITVKTNMRHIYAKLDAHRRVEAVEHARARGMLAPAWSRLAGLKTLP